MSRKSEQQTELFCRAYVIDLNGTKAAIAAGYSPKSAKVTASRLLTRANISARIAELAKEKADKLDITAERVLREISLLAFANMLDYMNINGEGDARLDFSSLTRDQAAAIQEIKEDSYGGGAGDGQRKQVLRTTFKLADKGMNLERLGRHLKLFTDKLEVSGLEGLADKLHRIRQKKNAG